MKKSNKVLLIGLGCVITILSYQELSKFNSVGVGFSIGEDNKKNETIVGNKNIASHNLSVPAFHAISVNGDFDVTINSGDKNQIEFKTDENIIPFINTSVANGNLSIGMKSGFQASSKQPIQVIITTRRFDRATCHGHVSLKALQVNANTFALSMNGDNRTRLRGAVQKLNITTAGDATIYTKELSAEHVILSSAGDSHIEVNANKTLSITSAGDMNLHYTGNPVVSKHIIGDATIKHDVWSVGVVK